MAASTVKRSKNRRLNRNSYLIERLEPRLLLSAYETAVLAAFNFPNGANPSDLLMDSAGNMYGITSSGSAHNDGTVFEIAAGGNSIRTLVNFNGTDGAAPCALVIDSNGNLYGATSNGFFFEHPKGIPTLTTLASFKNGVIHGPISLVIDSKGDLFGTTFFSSGAEAIFEIASGNSTIRVLASFNNLQNKVTTPLLIDSSGDLFVAAEYAGIYSKGIIYELAHGHLGLSTVATFDGTYGPLLSLLIDRSGNLYGTTGGGYGSSASLFSLFEYPANTTNIISVESLNNDNAYPAPHLLLASSGNLFGVTYSSGSFGNGIVFELAAGSSTISRLADITSIAMAPNSLAMNSSGQLFGSGGNGYGDVFRLVPAPSLEFGIQPHNNTAGLAFSPALTVSIEDVAGHIIDTSAIITLSDVPLSSGGFGVMTATAINGTATFGNAFVGVTGTYVLEAHSAQFGDDIEAISNTIVISPTKPSQLRYTQEPNIVQQGQPLDLAVAIEDHFGNLVTGDTSTVTMEITSGPSGADLSGTTTARVVNGFATFASLSLGQVGLYTLTAIDGSATGAETNNILVNPANSGITGLTIRASFNGTDGLDPRDLIVDSSGNLFGVVSSDTIFEIANGTSTFTTLGIVNSDLLMDSSGDLFGIQASSIIEIPKDGSEITLATFKDGSPTSLTLDTHGNLYGTAEEYGTYALFEVPANSTSITTLATFNSATRGEAYDVVINSSGDLFGFLGNTIFEFPKHGKSIYTVATFNASTGGPDSLLVDSSGNLFGTTASGNAGTLFELHKGSTNIKVLANFGNTYSDQSNFLLTDGFGNIYGTTQGALDPAGAIFEFSAGSKSIDILATFNDGTDGSNPAGLAMDSSGNLYAALFYDGSGGGGSVCELQSDQVGFIQQPINITAGQPIASAVTAGLENRFGNVFGGDSSTITLSLVNSAGTIVSMSTATAINGVATFGELSSTVAGTYSLAATDAPYISATSNAFLILAAAPAKLVFVEQPSDDIAGQRLDPICVAIEDQYNNIVTIDDSSVTLTQGSSLISARKASNGIATFAHLVFENTGLYTLVASDGSLPDAASSVFTIGPAAGLFTLAAFNDANGFGPDRLVNDSQGNLYGIAANGGPDSDGTIFEILKNSGSITSLASFNGVNGIHPEFLLIDSSGDLYGCTYTGNLYGTVFELTKGSSTITVISNMTIENDNPYGLVMDSSGNLWGITASGLGDLPSGSFQPGTFFEIPHGTSNVITVATLNVPTSGDYPYSLVMDSSGNLFASIYNGGDFAINSIGAGTVVELSKGSSSIKIIATFNGVDGMYPGPLVMDSSGNLFGATYDGGNFTLNQGLGDGTLYEIAHNSSSITDLVVFNNSTGVGPYSLILDNSGNLYGTTWQSNTVFELPKGGNIITIARLNNTEGSNPNALIMDSQGNLYGAAYNGGAFGDGDVFEIGSDHFAFVQQPSTTAAGKDITPAVRVEVEDYFGNAATNFSSTITLSILNSSGTSVLAATARAVNGVATFSHLSAKVGGIYTLQATGVGLATANSARFIVRGD